MSFKTRSLITALAAVSSVSLTHAAGLDRSTQPSWGFTQDGTFAYIEHVTINPSVEGKDTAGNTVPDMADDYQFLNFGAKADLNDTVTLGAFFDQPWGADVQFEGDNNFVGAPTNVINGIYGQTTQALQAAGLNVTINNATDLQNTISGLQTQVTAGQAQLTTANAQLAQAQAAVAANPALAPVLNPQITALQQGIAAGTARLQQGQAAVANLTKAQALTNTLFNIKGGTNVQVKSQNFTGLVGVKLGDKKNIQVYGGPALQRLEGDIHLRGNAYGPTSGYDAGIAQSTGVGWMAGIAYSKPEIALKASLTYRSEIDHDTDISESLPLAAAAGLNPVQVNETTITTPQSVNVDFQTGINPTTLLTAKLRWVPWSDFAVKPKLYNDLTKTRAPGGYNLVDYSDDGWTAEVGLGKKINDKLALSGAIGWDSGAGNPATTLGPVDGNWNVGLGAKYNFSPEWALSGGVKYLKFGDADAQLPDHKTKVGEFSDNDGMVYGVRLSYQKK